MTERNKISSFLVDDKYCVHRHLLLQVVILMITIGNFFDAPDKLNLTLNRFYSWLSYYLFLNVLVYFNAYVLFPCFLAKNRILPYIVSVVVFTFFMLFVMMILQDRFYDIAVIHQEAPSAMAIFLSITSSLLAILLFLGGMTALLLFKQWMTGQQRIDALKTVTSESELMFLKSQINPHFLFNMLNNANILVEDEPETASFILLKLDELLRYQLNDSLQEKVPLDTDIRFLNNYLELEKIRRDSFEYKININGNPNGVQVAPLLFIPFVENAVKHNGSDTGKSFVEASFCLKSGTLIFSCRNSVSVRPRPQKEKGGLGLANIRRRLELLFGNSYSLESTQTDEVYTINLQINL